MAELKTRRTDQSVETFLEEITDEGKRQESRTIVELMRGATNAEPRMWGPNIVGFGEHHYVYESGREGDWFIIGFSPRKQNLTLYLSSGFDAKEELLKRLGKHSAGKACIYIKRLADVDLAVLRELIDGSVKRTTSKA